MLDTLNFAQAAIDNLQFSENSQLGSLMHIHWNDIIELAICLIIPVLILFIVMLFQYSRRRNEYRLAEKAIKAGINIKEIENLIPKKRKSAKKTLLRRIVWGGFLSIGGLALIVVGCCDKPVDTIKVIFGALPLALGIGLILSFWFGRTLLAHSIELEDKEAEVEFLRLHSQSGSDIAKRSDTTVTAGEVEKCSADETSDPATERHDPEEEEK